ncbi:putative flavin-containing monooxygenase 1 [Vitis vinifera]|uniref:Flavin-containing monooxygenase n=1 Tax=Vitis vinifera TaxID=29760 RepID=A0A438IJ44_VITVI|nr:putative flavin-containing monooxygenase 1 [Vitis vinifera]
MERKVAIIGAGISGLLACKYTLSKGFTPVVFESRSSIGGVWRKTLETTKLQTPKPFYQFSDFPWPSSVKEEFPNQFQLFDYLQSYARHFDLLRHIKFNSKVVSIEYEGASDEEMQAWELWGGNGEPFSSKGKWNLTVTDTQILSTEVYQVDFVILCIGRFTDVPNIPEFPPQNSSKGNEQLWLVSRNMHWTYRWSVQQANAMGVPLAYLYFSRFSELLVHKPGEGFFLSLLATILSPVRWGFSKWVESHIKKKLSLEKFGMVPKHSFLKEISACLISTVPEGFYDRVEKGSIILKKAPKFSFCEQGIVVDGEITPIETDLVILATGFKGEKKLKDIFVSPAFQDCILGSPNCIVPFYSGNWILGEYFKPVHIGDECRWLAELLDSTFKLPSIKEMEKDAARWDKYMKQSSGEYYRRSCIGALHIWYNDQLCKDMGWNPKRKKGFFAELLSLCPK